MTFCSTWISAWEEAMLPICYIAPPHSPPSKKICPLLCGGGLDSGFQNTHYQQIDRTNMELELYQ